jgi:glycosyltransferase involved in cell wall biosynthesis
MLANVRFFLVGEGPLKGEVEQRICREQLNDVCFLRPWMDPLLIYWAGDLLVLPSSVEGFGLAAAEALATGCPVLRTRTGGFELMIKEGVTGFGCTTSEEDFVNKGLEVLANPTVLIGMRRAARLQAEDELDVEAEAARTVALYRHALLENC